MDIFQGPHQDYSKSGFAENTIRLLPPLNTSEDEINKAFNTLNEVILELKKNSD